MAVTPNYSWPVPVNTDLVKDGAEAIKDLGDAIDATVFGLPSGALALVKSQVIGTAVSSVNVTSAFSATYDNYHIVISGGASTGLLTIGLRLGASTTQYWSGRSGVIFVGAAAALVSENNTSNWANVGNARTTGLSANIELNSPFLARPTFISAQVAGTSAAGMTVGVHDVSTSYTDFTISLSSGSLTGGTIRVYGYQN